MLLVTQPDQHNALTHIETLPDIQRERALGIQSIDRAQRTNAKYEDLFKKAEKALAAEKDQERRKSVLPGSTPGRNMNSFATIPAIARTLTMLKLQGAGEAKANE
jgi:tRNA pseudouridine-54 N-methylase